MHYIGTFNIDKAGIEFCKKENARILSQQKKPEELITAYSGTAREINRIYYAGNGTTYFELYAQPNQVIPNLHFNSASLPVNAGDNLEVFIFRGQKKELKEYRGVVYYPNREPYHCPILNNSRFEIPTIWQAFPEEQFVGKIFAMKRKLAQGTERIVDQTKIEEYQLKKWLTQVFDSAKA